MSNTSKHLPRRSGVMAALANSAGVALQNWAARREAVSVESLQFQENLAHQRESQAGAMHDGLLR
ncbi:hypothetical protein [Arthrobacter sp. 35W]|uniref:hypothetical protein n=1 Tax=Arthrobacter sp. 35W TaxID=1132441 RepID=UPI0003F75A7B|nr:hypothetical protein [Arthrobacter sp. 35W]